MILLGIVLGLGAAFFMTISMILSATGWWALVAAADSIEHMVREVEQGRIHEAEKHANFAAFMLQVQHEAAMFAFPWNLLIVVLHGLGMALLKLLRLRAS